MAAALSPLAARYRKLATDGYWPKVSVAEWLLSGDVINLSKFLTNQPSKAQLSLCYSFRPFVFPCLRAVATAWLL